MAGNVAESDGLEIICYVCRENIFLSEHGIHKCLMIFNNYTFKTENNDYCICPLLDNGDFVTAATLYEREVHYGNVIFNAICHMGAGGCITERHKMTEPMTDGTRFLQILKQLIDELPVPYQWFSKRSIMLGLKTCYQYDGTDRTTETVFENLRKLNERLSTQKFIHHVSLINEDLISNGHVSANRYIKDIYIDYVYNYFKNEIMLKECIQLGKTMQKLEFSESRKRKRFD